MPNPPTFNDLKRRRSSAEETTFRRFKIIPGRAFQFRLPPLPNPFIINLLGTELLDPIGTENLDELGIDIYSNNVVSIPDQNSLEFYTNRNINVTPVNYPFDSLWFLNNNFKVKTNQFTFFIEKQQTGIHNIERKFYSSFTPNDQITETYSFTGYNFDELVVNLSADKSSISFEAGDINGENISLKNNLSEGRFLNKSVEFKIDFGEGEGQSSVYDNFDTITTNNYSFSLPFTGTKTITLSTIRNDGLYGLNKTTLTINFDIQESFISHSRLDSIHTTWQTISSVPNPEGEEDKFRFLNNPTNTSAEWNTEWWGYNSRDLYNFSGVTYKATGFHTENNITLITPKHGVCNEHWGDDPKAGDVGFFYDHTTGNAISAEIVSAFDTGTSDIRMVKFDRDLTAEGDIKVYKLPLLLNPIGNYILCTIYQGGNGPFGTGSSDRHAGLGTHRDVIDVQGIEIFNTEFASTDLWQVSSVFDGTYFGLSSLDVGDSSSPTFIIHDNDILLANTFTTGSGGGPNYALSAIQSILSAGLETLGNSEGYTLSTVELS